MKKKAILLDFYGTVVDEDDKIVKEICEEIAISSKTDMSAAQIGSHWWKEFSSMCNCSYGSSFRTQQELELLSLKNVISFTKANVNAENLSTKMFRYWVAPEIFADSLDFVRFAPVPICIVSNIDRRDIEQAMKFHGIQTHYIVTSEDVRSYKPRAEIFLESLNQLGLQSGEVIHIGDSLNSDVQGAQNLGITALWLNRKNKQLPPDISPDYTAETLAKVLELGLFD